jgi:recombination protein RecT
MALPAEVRKEQATTIKALLANPKVREQIQLALPKHMDPDRLLRIATTSILKNSRLMECSSTSLLAALIQAAQLGLEPDDILGYAYLVPYKNECQLQPGYKGLMKLARNSGEIVKIWARIVYEKDKFDYQDGTDEYLLHKRSDAPNPGKATHAYAIAKYKNGDCQFEVMSVAQIELHRQRSKAKDSGPWVTDLEAMQLKTVARKLCKWLPTANEPLARAVALDERADAGIPQGIENAIDVDFNEIIDEATPAAAPGPKAIERSTLDQVVDQHDAPPMPPPVKKKKVATGGGRIGVAKQRELITAWEATGRHYDELQEWLKDSIEVPAGALSRVSVGQFEDALMKIAVMDPVDPEEE